MIHRFRAVVVAAATVAGLVAGSAVAQECGPRWLPGEGIPGTSGYVYATTMWDPDGLGPREPCLVVGGTFVLAGKNPVQNIALYDEATGEWSPLGSGVSGESAAVSALAVLPNGDLIAGGVFTTAGGVPANGIARWDGSEWSALGTGVGGGSPTTVNAITALPNGDIVVGGWFATAGGVTVNNIARWDGSAWSALGSGMDNRVSSLAVLPSGELVAGGYFAAAGGVVVNGIASWDGSTWSPLGPGATGFVNALAVLPNGDLLAGGYINRMGETIVGHVARWDGSAWSSLGEGLGSFDNAVNALAVTPSGDVIAGGRFITGFTPIAFMYRWNGSSWSHFGASDYSSVLTVTVLPDGDVVAGGSFTAMDTDLSARTPTPYVARWDGSVWSQVGSGTDGSVSALALLPNGDLAAGGRFTSIGGASAKNVACWNGSAWSPLGSGLVQSVSALAVLPNGELVAGGGIFRDMAFRWDGSSWSSLGAGAGESVYAFAVMPNGDLIAGGRFTSAGGVAVNNIARWDGSAWFALGSGLTGGAQRSVRSLAVLPNGDLVAGGTFETAGGVSVYNIAKWNGTSWSAVGTGLSGDAPAIFAMKALPNGDLIAGGSFTTSILTSVNYIARWNGSAWSQLGMGMNDRVLALEVLPSGDLIATGRFTSAGGTPVEKIARWNGSAWSPLASGSSGANALAALPNGELAVAGSSSIADGTYSAYFSRYSFTGVPTMSVQPEARTLGVGETLTVSATPGSGYSGVSVRWLRDGEPIADGSGGAAAGGGVVSGASGVMESPTDGTPALLTIEDAQASDSGSYTAVFMNDCGEMASVGADVVVRSECLADLDGDGVVDFTDYLEFLNLFDAGDLRADFTSDGLVDFSDHLEFLNHFEAGC